jgi:hypothetical protein
MVGCCSGLLLLQTSSMTGTQSLIVRECQMAGVYGGVPLMISSEVAVGVYHDLVGIMLLDSESPSSDFHASPLLPAMVNPLES